MSAAPHLKRKDLKLCSHTRRPGQKSGLFVFKWAAIERDGPGLAPKALPA
jgi:hypothetical protein